MKDVEIIEAHAMPDHIHMRYLKGKSSLMIFDRYANLKYRYGNRKFWCRGFYVDTVGRNKKQVQEYIQNQLRLHGDQLTLFEPFDHLQAKKSEEIRDSLRIRE